MLGQANAARIPPKKGMHTLFLLISARSHESMATRSGQARRRNHSADYLKQPDMDE